jgi:transcriptional regulator with XRE-family HTH domain
MTDQQIQDNRLHIGQRIAQLRQEKGLTQMELARKAAIQQATLSRIEKGAFSIGLDALSSVLAALDHKIDFAEK